MEAIYTISGKIYSPDLTIINILDSDLDRTFNWRRIIDRKDKFRELNKDFRNNKHISDNNNIAIKRIIEQSKKVILVGIPQKTAAWEKKGFMNKQMQDLIVFGKQHAITTYLTHDDFRNHANKKSCIINLTGIGPRQGVIIMQRSWLTCWQNVV